MEDSRLAAAPPAGGYGALGVPVAAPVAQHMDDGSQKALLGTVIADDPAASTWCPNPLSNILCGLLLPCGICNSVRQINVNEQAAAIYWGEYVGTVSKPGLYLMNPFGLQLWKISTKMNTLQLKDIKVLDARGNPVCINGVVTFKGSSAKKATIDVTNPWPMGPSMGHQSFLELQAAAVLKRVASRFPYEAPAGEASLQSEGRAMGEELQKELQEKVACTGALIQSFDLVDLSYAPEIAQVMLVRQQAEALVGARKTLVAAAVNMTQDAVDALKEKQGLDPKTCQHLTANLLTVICSGSAAVPTLNVGS